MFGFTLICFLFVHSYVKKSKKNFPNNTTLILFLIFYNFEVFLCCQILTKCKKKEIGQKNLHLLHWDTHPHFSAAFLDVCRKDSQVEILFPKFVPNYMFLLRSLLPPYEEFCVKILYKPSFKTLNHLKSLLIRIISLWFSPLNLLKTEHFSASIVCVVKNNSSLAMSWLVLSWNLWNLNVLLWRLPGFLCRRRPPPSDCRRFLPLSCSPTPTAAVRSPLASSAEMNFLPRRPASLVWLKQILLASLPCVYLLTEHQRVEHRLVGGCLPSCQLLSDVPSFFLFLNRFIFRLELVIFHFSSRRVEFLVSLFFIYKSLHSVPFSEENPLLSLLCACGSER